MPHKYVTKDVLDRLRAEISARDVEIRSIRSISRRDKEGIDNFLARVKILLDSSKKKKDTALDGLMEDGRPRSGPDGSWVPAPLIDSRIQERMSLIFRGEEKAFEAVVEMFENPDAAVDFLVQEKDTYERQLREYEKMEQRDSPTV